MKYRNTPVSYDGIRFASMKEGRRYLELKMLQQGKLITSLQCQPRYELWVNGQKICTYVADFSYVMVEGGEQVVEDVKSLATITPVFKLKQKLMKAIHGIEISIV